MARGAAKLHEFEDDGLGVDDRVRMPIEHLIKDRMWVEPNDIVRRISFIKRVQSKGETCGGQERCYQLMLDLHYF